MAHEPDLPDTDLIADQVPYLRGIYDELAGLVAVAQGQRDSADKGERGKGYRKLNNPILGQTTPANGIDIADRAVLTIVNKDKATIAAGAEAAARLALAIIEANRRRAFEENRQADAARNSASKLPAEYQYFFSEMEKRLVTRSMLDAMTQEEFDVLAQLIQQKNDLPTHPTLKGLWNFCFRAGIVNHTVRGLTDDEKAAIQLIFEPDAVAGMAAQAFFNEAAGRRLDLPLPLALALVADKRSENRSRGLKRTAEHIATEEYERTAQIIRKALGLKEDQLAELVDAWQDIFDRHFHDIEQRRADAVAQREHEILAFVPAAQALGERYRQAAADEAARRPPAVEDEACDDDDDPMELDAIHVPEGFVVFDDDELTLSVDLPLETNDLLAEFAQDRAAYQASTERFEQRETLERAALLHDSRFTRDGARRHGIPMPGDEPCAAQVPQVEVEPNAATTSRIDQPRSQRDRFAAYLKDR